MNCFNNVCESISYHLPAVVVEEGCNAISSWRSKKIGVGYGTFNFFFGRSFGDEGIVLSCENWSDLFDKSFLSSTVKASRLKKELTHLFF